MVSRRKRIKRRITKKRKYKPLKADGAPLKIGVLAMFKNESMILREWIEHYKWQGVDMILLLNNNSDDDWQSIVKDYEGFVTVKDTPEKHAQLKYYTEVGVPFFKENGFDVLVLVDIDEYYFGKDGRLIKDYVQEIFTKEDRPSSIQCGWSMFGSSGHVKQPKSIREEFTMRPSNTPDNRNVKSIMMISDISGGIVNSQHNPIMTGRIDQCPPGLQVNHYQIMSKEYFDKVKAKRGNASNPLTETFRNEEYWKKGDINLVKDTLLADQVAAFKRG